jgi:hypothetical protein
MSKLKSMVDDFNVQKKTFMKKMSDSFVTELLLEAKKIEGLKSIRWTQYAPYFNDGEACTFSVYESEFQIEDDEDYYDIWSIKYHAEQKKKPVFAGLEELKVLKSTIDSIPNEVMEDMYGDGVQVTINVETGEVDVQDYEHD